jgi:hypothetical protein
VTLANIHYEQIARTGCLGGRSVAIGELSNYLDAPINPTQAYQEHIKLMQRARFTGRTSVSLTSGADKRAFAGARRAGILPRKQLV